MATSIPDIDISKQINQAKDDFLRDVDKIRALESVDRAHLAAAFQLQAEKLIKEEVQPRVAQLMVAIASMAQDATRQTPPPAPPPNRGGGEFGGDIPRRVERLEGQVEKMGDDIGEIKVTIGTVLERLRHMPLRTEMYLAGGTALAILLSVMAKGFGWL